MLPVQVPVGLSLILALGAGSAAWTARLDGKDGSKISGTAQVESAPAMPPVMPPVMPKSEPEPVSEQASFLAAEERERLEELLDELAGLKSRLHAARNR